MADIVVRWPIIVVLYKMRLLIITQKVDEDDSNLGFFVGWLEKLAQKLDRVYVICLWQGKHKLPGNVKVLSLAKEKGASKIEQIFRLKFFLLKHLKEVDGVFCHMAPIYAILAYPLARLFGKKMVLWFLHRETNWKLKMASRLVDTILTASEESCQLKNRGKIKVVGAGVDTEVFKPGASLPTEKFNVLNIGRISEIKDQATLVRAIDILVNQRHINGVQVKIVGEPIDAEEKKYAGRIMDLAGEKGLEDYIKFLGPVSYGEAPRLYQVSDALVNLCPTGGMDKVVLEAMASGILVLAANLTFQKEFGLYAGKLIFQHADPMELADKIIGLKRLSREERGKMGQYLRQRVLQEHNLDGLMLKIINEFKKQN